MREQLPELWRAPLPLPALRPGLAHEWSLEKYGELLEIGGGKERMDHYFKVGTSLSRLMSA